MRGATDTALRPPSPILLLRDMAASIPRLIDVSHTVEDGLVTYRGLPAPIICDFLSFEASHAHYAEGTEFNIGRIDMVANTGTYVDSPFHRYRDGADLSELELSALADLDAVVVRVPSSNARAIGEAWFEGVPVAGRAVLVHTGWDRHWATESYFEGHPYLTGEAARMLVRRGARLVGIDSLNIDDTQDGGRPVHTALLGAGIPVVEHLCNLHRLPDRGFRFHAVPVKVRGMGTFPVRAYGVLASNDGVD
jgi:arylformamidase